MNKGLYISVLLLSFMVSTFGQNTLTYDSNAYLSGDQHHYIVVNNIEDLNEGAAGYNKIWDYTHLVSGDSVTSFLLDATQQQAYDYFPETNIVIREYDRDHYLSVSPEGMEEYGYSTPDYSYKYDIPIKRFSFPFVYGKKIGGEYTSEKIGSPETLYGGVYNSEIDGYGTLFLPGNIEIKDVLRVRTSQRKDSSKVEYVAYRWYSQYSDPVLRYPLLSIIKTESNANSYVRSAAYYAHAEQLVEQAPISFGTITPLEFTTLEASILKIKAYPNPFVEKVTVVYDLPSEAEVTIIVSDALGRVVETLVDRKQKAGIYTVEFKGDGYFFLYYITTIINGRVVSTKKLIHVNR